MRIPLHIKESKKEDERGGGVRRRRRGRRRGGEGNQGACLRIIKILSHFKTYLVEESLENDVNKKRINTQEGKEERGRRTRENLKRERKSIKKTIKMQLNINKDK